MKEHKIDDLTRIGADRIFITLYQVTLEDGFCRALFTFCSPGLVFSKLYRHLQQQAEFVELFEGTLQRKLGFYTKACFSIVLKLLFQPSFFKERI